MYDLLYYQHAHAAAARPGSNSECQTELKSQQLFLIVVYVLVYIVNNTVYSRTLWSIKRPCRSPVASKKSVND